MIVDSFPHCVWLKIVPLSVERTQPKECREWPFRHIVRDWNGQASEPCALTSLRDQFQMRYAFAKHMLWVCSQRIFKFGPLVLEHCRCLSASDSERSLMVLFCVCKVNPCAKALERLAGAKVYPIVVNAFKTAKFCFKYSAVISRMFCTNEKYQVSQNT